MEKTTILSLKLKAYREEQHLTQAQLAEILDVSDKTISKWEQGATYHSKSNLLKLSERLGFSLEALLLDEKIEQGRSIRLGFKWGILAFFMNAFILIALNYIQGSKNIFTASVTTFFMSFPVALIVGFVFAWYFYPKKDKHE